MPLEGLTDPVVLALAAQDGGVLVSHDVNTMEGHFREFIRDNKSPLTGGLSLVNDCSWKG